MIKIISLASILAIITPRILAQSQSPACHYFETNLSQLVGTDNFKYTASTENVDSLLIPKNAQMACVIDPRNPQWVLAKILSGTDLQFTISSSLNNDIDAAIWGPISNQNISNTCEILQSYPLDCEYDTLASTLEISNVVANDYYLIMICNFSNDSTEINIGQPNGGSVKYFYYCPENIQLNTSLSGGQNQYAKNTIKLATSINAQANIQALSGNSIELLPGFQSSLGVVFESKIQDCNIVNIPYAQPALSIPCESFGNHTSASPHLYANTRQNELVGTVYAINAPQYRVNNVWFDMQKLGLNRQNERYLWFYRHPYTSVTNVALRTSPNCPHYDDARNTYPYQYLGEEDDQYPSWLENVTSTFNLQTPFYLSHDIQYQNSGHTIWGFYIKPDLPNNLSYRINDGIWRWDINTLEGFEEYSERYLNVKRLGYSGFWAPKDFVIDFRNIQNQIDRYFVSRNSAGGHFSVTTTFTRAADSTVYVTTFQGDMDVALKLGPYHATELFGTTFYLGKMAEGTYYFPLTSRKEEIVLDEQIMVRVRYN